MGTAEVDQSGKKVIIQCMSGSNAPRLLGVAAWIEDRPISVHHAYAYFHGSIFS